MTKIPLDVPGRVLNSSRQDHHVRVDDDWKASGGLLIHEWWSGSNGPNAHGAFDSWVETLRQAEEFLKEKGWEVEWPAPLEDEDDDLPLPQGGYLGDYDGSQLEYQIDAILIWVMVDASRGEEWSVRRANEMFDDAWNSMPVALKCAQQVSRKEMPEFWMAHDQAGTADEQLAVWIIALEPEARIVRYFINRNHHFNARGRTLPEWESNNFIYVTNSKGEGYTVRTGSGKYSLGNEV